MDRILRTIEDLSGREPDVLVHAPFADPRNLTPYASLGGGLCDFSSCAGRHVALFGTQDKTETRGLFARIVKAGPASLTVVWEKDKGGAALVTMIKDLGWDAAQDSRAHARFALFSAFANHPLLHRWIAESEARPVLGTSGMFAEPGLFSYREIDAASALLVKHLPQRLSGNVADFGCGWGVLSREILCHDDVKKLYAIDDDVRAVARTKANCKDARLETLCVDITRGNLPTRLDAIVMNPPFHMHGTESKKLGQTFIERAAQSLKKGGKLYMVANRHLPYERVIGTCFAAQNTLYTGEGFKIIEAVKGD